MTCSCACHGRAKKTWNFARTARYMALTFAARGLMEGVAAVMPESGELALHPRLGLESLANVLGRPWEETRPALEEALESGKLVFDAERNVLIDQTRVESRAGATLETSRSSPARPSCSNQSAQPGSSGPEPAPSGAPPELTLAPVAVLEELVSVARELLERAGSKPDLAPVLSAAAPSTTPAAIRSRAFRARKKLEALARTPNAFANACPPPSAAETPVISVPLEQCTFAFAERSRTSPLSDLSDLKSKKTRGERVVLVRANADGSADITPMPSGWIEAAAAKHPGLPTSTIHDTWSVFAANSRKKNASFPSWPVVQVLWEKWLRDEHAPKAMARPLKKARPSAAELEAKRRDDEEARRLEAMPTAERLELAQQRRQGLEQLFAVAS